MKRKVRLMNVQAEGFTLVELMVTMAISSVIVLAIITAFSTQQRIQNVQDQVVAMQQNLRAAISFIGGEMRLAGYDPLQFRPANAGIVAATSNYLQFTMDLNRNGNVPPASPDPGEMVEFSFSNADDADNDGIADAGAASFGRQTGGAGGFQPVADNIAAVEFLYVLPDTSNNGVYDPQTTLTPTATELNGISAVTISMLARAANSDPNYFETVSFTTASGAVWAYADNFRRKMIITTIQLRNWGL